MELCPKVALRPPGLGNHPRGLTTALRHCSWPTICWTQNRIPNRPSGLQGRELGQETSRLPWFNMLQNLTNPEGPINSVAKLPWGRATVSQTVHIDFAPLRPFESLLFCRATVSWNMPIDFAPLRPIETLFLCRATVSWNMRINFVPLRRFAATCRTQNRIPKRP